MTEQIMDEMDIDDIVEVPDTPDRLATQRINGRGGVREENHRSSFPYNNSLPQKFHEQGFKEEPMVIDGGRRNLPLHPPKLASSSSNSRNPINATGFTSNTSSSSSRNALLFRKGATEKNPSFQNRVSKSSCQDDSFIDLTERDLHRPGSGNMRAEFGKRSGLANGASSLHGLTNFSTTSCNEKRDGVSGGGSSTVFGERLDFVGNNQKKPVNNGFLSRDPISSPKVNKQKRLVRNGCISPNNIAKAEQLSGKDINGSVGVACCNNGSVVSSAPPISVDIRELVAEDRKGKGALNHSWSSKGSDIKNKIPYGRSSTGFDKNAFGSSDHIRGNVGKSIEEVSGWRSTRNRTREINLLSPDTEPFSIRETEALRFSSQLHENRPERKGKAISVPNGDSHSKDANAISSSLNGPGTRLGRLNGPRSVADTFIKRQKQGECSTSVSSDQEVVFLSSSQEAVNSKSSNSRNTNNLQPIIEVDESSPELRRNNDRDEEVRARQVEADEMMALELQEQFYSELPVFGAGEMDENIALALQNQDDTNLDLPRARHPLLDPVPIPNLHGQSQPRSSSNITRRGSLSRAATSGRMTRPRNRFPGQPRTMLPSRRGRSSLFPADMDVDMRMHILGALEELSGLEVSPGMLQANRDFNENDYEMLLALDENNDRHGGASTRQINGLPQSTVQSDNFEACAICLDTPIIGDTIRHLPCLHKFHKDCIDPWLRRKTSCPVCKSSVT
ncbi:hypothetical protein ABFS83_14G032800 [Erythranthe nasuta]